MRKLFIYSEILLSVLIVLTVSSCATLLHRDTVDVNFYADTDSMKIRLKSDTTAWHQLPVTLCVERAKNDLQIIAKQDSVEKSIYIESALSTTFWLGNIFSGVGVVGHAIDMTNSKRYTYPANITLDFEHRPQSHKYYYSWKKPQKGLLSLKFSIPESNHFYINKGNSYGNSFGFMGLMGGIEYYLSDRVCLSSDIGIVMNFMVPFPAPVTYDGPHEFASAKYVNVQVGSDFKRFHYAAGVQYNRSRFVSCDTIPQNESTQDRYYLSAKKIQSNLGFVVSSYYRVSHNFNLGVSYNPSFFIFDDRKFKTAYSHLLFFDLQFRFDANKPWL